MNSSLSLVYLPPHLERSQPFPRVGPQASTQDMPQDMSWTSYNSYTRTVPSNSPEEQPLYPSMNRIPGPYSLPWMASTDYMGRTQPQSQCSFQSDAPQFAHNGLDSSGTPLTRRRAREEDSAALSGSPATYGNTDSSQVRMRKNGSYSDSFIHIMFFVLRSMAILTTHPILPLLTLLKRWLTRQMARSLQHCTPILTQRVKS